MYTNEIRVTYHKFSYQIYDDDDELKLDC